MDSLVNSFLAGPPTMATTSRAANELSSAKLTSRFAFVTMLTDDSFYPGVSVLCKSLRKRNQKYPVYVMLTKEVAKSTVKQLEKQCDGLLLVEKILSPFGNSGSEPAPPSTTPSSSSSSSTAPAAPAQNQPSWVGSDMTKLNLWSLTQFDKLLYIDADCLVQRNVESLFDLPTTFAAAPDIFPPDKFNAGVLLLTPDVSVFQQMVEALPLLPSYDGGDTGFLNAFFYSWYKQGPEARLPFGYNAQRTLYWFTHEKQPGYWQSVQPLSIIHYSSSPKPWQQTGKKGELELLWWSEYMS